MNKVPSLPQASPSTDAPDLPWLWMGVALLAHTGWGAYPVLARYLQTVSVIPSMALLGLGNLVGLTIFAPFVVRHLNWRLFKLPALWAFTFAVVMRAITNILAARFTLAIYVQLITLMTPLIVALLSAGIFRERLPRGTWPAIGFSLLGSLLLMGGDIAGHMPSLMLSGTDLLGIGLALVSAIFLAIYMILVPRTVKDAVPADVILFIHLLMLGLISGAISLLIGENWGRYTELGLKDWAVFLSFVLFVLLGSNLSQIVALRHLGAPMVSSTMAWRLVATLMLAALLLGERLSSLWQLLGAVIVIVTISLYLRHQQRS